MACREVYRSTKSFFSKPFDVGWWNPYFVHETNTTVTTLTYGIYKIDINRCCCGCQDHVWYLYLCWVLYSNFHSIGLACWSCDICIYLGGIYLFFFHIKYEVFTLRLRTPCYTFNCMWMKGSDKLVISLIGEELEVLRSVTSPCKTPFYWSVWKWRQVSELWYSQECYFSKKVIG